jgi:hypothetical protein
VQSATAVPCRGENLAMQADSARGLKSGHFSIEIQYAAMVAPISFPPGALALAFGVLANRPARSEGLRRPLEIQYPGSCGLKGFAANTTERLPMTARSPPNTGTPTRPPRIDFRIIEWPATDRLEDRENAPVAAQPGIAISARVRNSLVRRRSGRYARIL